ncbi:hypothetical protein F4604DRAFT_1919670 [Suillus subluteus]|nr:hypothetical protein F4604DRAFT_1919670 [Suillus subluteus]
MLSYLNHISAGLGYPGVLPPEFCQQHYPGEDDKAEEEKVQEGNKIGAQSSLLPGTSIFRIHGSLESHTNPSRGSRLYVNSPPFLPQRPRNLLPRPLFFFARPWHPVVLTVTPLGRTARAENGGEAWNTVAPSESEWSDGNKVNITLEGASIENILAKGFGGKGSGYEDHATEAQLPFERWVLRRNENAELARRAFISHMRVYATHPSNEKYVFHVRHIHIGHLAKAFALREAPKTITDGKNKVTSASKGRGSRPAEPTKQHDGQLSKKTGKMVSSGTDEFQIASGAALDLLVRGDPL